ncbi:predicted GPI-anchored protein 58 [Bufo gargarizans]|uniref:predicted GPI-anchored protein 58 n=1 Tax=Bufo gargarizans TaxID=30331 RepID=UPI001CF34340|nr:predicted GPI-anchored protein 58 [Bufo gargarizans]
MAADAEPAPVEDAADTFSKALDQPAPQTVIGPRNDHQEAPEPAARPQHQVGADALPEAKARSVPAPALLPEGPDTPNRPTPALPRTNTTRVGRLNPEVPMVIPELPAASNLQVAQINNLVMTFSPRVQGHVLPREVRKMSLITPVATPLPGESASSLPPPQLAIPLPEPLQPGVLSLSAPAGVPDIQQLTAALTSLTTQTVPETATRGQCSSITAASLSYKMQERPLVFLNSSCSDEEVTWQDDLADEKLTGGVNYRTF